MSNSFEKIPLANDHWYCGPEENEVDEALKEHPLELREIVDRNPYTRNGLKVLRAFGDYTLPHSVMAGRYGWELGRESRLDRFHLEKLTAAGLVHDLGKILLADSEILQKEGAMTEAEAKEMREHARGSFNFIRETDPYVAEIIVRHHEEKKSDPYPRNHDRRKNPNVFWDQDERRRGERRKKIEELDPQMRSLVRYLAIIDEFESLTSPLRPYRRPLDMSNDQDRKKLQEIFQKDYPSAGDQAVMKKLIDISQHLEKTFARAA